VIPHVIAGAALGCLLAGVGGFFYGLGMGRDLEAGAQKRVEQAQAETLAAAALGTAQEIAKLEPKLVTLKERVTREIIKEPVYRDCVHTPDGLRAINDALTAQPGNPFGGGGVPVPDAPGGP
jgi:hypothetical protein